jgi:hypothetical protein
VTLSALKIITEFVKRLAIEATFQEAREHLGIETQRQWSNKAIARETPALFALYSIVILIGLQLRKIPVRTAAWYSKQCNTFSDVLVEARRILWRDKYFLQAVEKEDFILDFVHFLRVLFGVSRVSSFLQVLFLYIL